MQEEQVHNAIWTLLTVCGETHARTTDKMDSSFKGRLPVILQRDVLIPQLMQLSIVNIEVLGNKPWSVRVADKESVFEPSLSVRARFVRFQKQA